VSSNPMVLRARQVEWRFPRPAIIMGIVNVTPDSFSDGGRFLEPGAAVEQALRLVEDGAEIIDVGGESTRPNAQPVTEAEELRRVMPVLERLVGQVKALVSIDTYKPGVARQAVQAGAGMINDIAAGRHDPEMWKIVAETGAAYVVMHMQGTPQTMQRSPAYQDVSQEVGAFFQERLKRLAESGVNPNQVVLDVGIGFGKSREHNLQLLAQLRSFTRFERPLLLGVSRKSFLGACRAEPLHERLPGALGISAWAVGQGAGIFRTHDVRPTLRAIRMAEEILQYSKKQQINAPGA
jgi:dihydropteroate synthase